MFKNKTDDERTLSYLNYQVKHGVPLKVLLHNLGYIQSDSNSSKLLEAKEIIK